MSLKPLNDRVILKQLEAEETTKGGIILTTQSKEKPQEAEVIAVGPGCMVNGEKFEMTVKVGDTVIYSRFGGNNVKIGKEEFVIVKQDDILAIVE